MSLCPYYSLKNLSSKCVEQLDNFIVVKNYLFLGHSKSGTKKENVHHYDVEDNYSFRGEIISLMYCQIDLTPIALK